MRTFDVWFHAGSHKRETSVEMPDSASDEDCEVACLAALDALIESADSGWRETTEGEEER